MEQLLRRGVVRNTDNWDAKAPPLLVFADRPKCERILKKNEMGSVRDASQKRYWRERFCEASRTESARPYFAGNLSIRPGTSPAPLGTVIADPLNASPTAS